ncbi:MAG: S8 family serine peptidase, partial [bacterium]|nr:S8 family serine peptidase [bacterium]
PSINGDMKPDVVAPGVNIISTQASGSFLDARNEHNQYIAQSGSSLAAPLVSGLCALMLQANPDLTVSDIKDIIMETSSKVNGKSDFEQGKGVISPEKAIEKAISMRK